MTFCQAQRGNMAGGAPYPWIRAGDGWEIGRAGGWYRGAELAGVLAVPLFNRGSSARRRQCTWRPAWSPRMWAWSETRAAGSRNDQCHATQRCRNTSHPGRRPSRQSHQQQGLREDKERGIIQIWGICRWPATAKKEKRKILCLLEIAFSQAKSLLFVATGPILLKDDCASWKHHNKYYHR